MHPNPMVDTFRSTPKMREFTVKCRLASIVLIKMMIVRIFTLWKFQFVTQYIPKGFGWKQILTNASTEYRSILRILLKGVGLSAMLPAQSEAVTE